MPTRNISLTDHLDAVVETSVASGQYQNASEVVRDALRLLEARQRNEALKLERLREAAKVGFDAIDRGDYTDLEPDEIGEYIAQLGREASARLKASGR